MLKRKQIEELFFLFSMQVAKKQDFINYLSILQKSKWNFSLKKIHSFFTKNYFPTIRNYSEEIGVDSETINQFDTIFIQQWTQEKIIDYFEKDFLTGSKEIDKKMLVIQINQFINNQKNFEKIQPKLKFFFFVVYKLQDKQITSEIVQMIQSMLTSKKIEKIKAIQINNDNVNFPIIKVVQNLEGENRLYAFHYNLLCLLELIHRVTDKNISYLNEMFQQLKILFESLANENKHKNDVKNIFFKFMDILPFQNADFYWNIFDIFYHKDQYNNQNVLQIKSELIQCLYQAFLKYKLKISYLYNKLKDKFANHIEELFYLERFTLISSIIISLTDEIKKSEEINMILKTTEQKLMDLSKKNKFIDYSYYYLCLMSQNYNLNQLLQKLKKIKFKEESSERCFDVYCVFFYLNKNIKKLIEKQQCPLFQIFQSLNNENTDKVDPFSYIDDKYFKLHGEKNAIQSMLNQKKLFKIITNKHNPKAHKNIQSLLHFFENLPNKGYEIFFLETDNSSCSYLINNFKLIENRYFDYELIGLFMTNKNNKKYIFIYDKSFDIWHDLNKCENEISQMKKFNLVYFKIDKHSHKFLQKYLISNHKHEQITQDKQYEILWKSLEELIHINPNIIETQYKYLNHIFNFQLKENQQKLSDIVSPQVCKPQNLDISSGNSENNLHDAAMVNDILKFVHTYGDKDILEIIFNKIINGKKEKLDNETAFYFGIIILNKKIKGIEKIFHLEKMGIDQKNLRKMLNFFNQKNFLDYMKLDKIYILIKSPKTKIEQAYYFMFKTLFLLEVLSTTIYVLGNEMFEQEINDLLEDKDCFSNEFLEELFPNLLSYILQTNSQLHNEISVENKYLFLERFVGESLVLREGNLKQHYNLLKIFIDFHLTNENYFPRFFNELLFCFKLIFKRLLSKGDEIIIADILMVIMDNVIKQKLPIEDVYTKMKSYLKELYFKTQNKLLKYSIILLFTFAKNQKIENKIKYILSFPFENKDKTFLDSYLIFIIFCTDIKKYIHTIKTDTTKNIQNIFDFFISFQQKYDDSKNDNFLQIKDFYVKLKEGKLSLEEILNTSIKQSLINENKLESISTLFKDSFPYILFVRMTNNDVKFDHSMMQINEIYYLTGLSIVYDKKEKSLFIFNQYKLEWYSVNSKKWVEKLPKDGNITSIFFIYTRKTKENKNRNIDLNCLKEITPFNTDMYKNCKFNYFESYQWLVNLNKNIRIINKDFIENLFKSTQKTYFKSSETDNNENVADYIYII